MVNVELPRLGSLSNKFIAHGLYYILISFNARFLGISHNRRLKQFTPNDGRVFILKEILQPSPALSSFK
jgi:hypothetical protein